MGYRKTEKLDKPVTAFFEIVGYPSNTIQRRFTCSIGYGRDKKRLASSVEFLPLVENVAHKVGC